MCFRQVWEWCINHLMNVCLIDAFGISIDKSKSKHKAARTVFDEVTKVIGSMRSSQGATQWFETLQFSLLATNLKLKNVAPTRWSSAVTVSSYTPVNAHQLDCVGASQSLDRCSSA